MKFKSFTVKLLITSIIAITVLCLLVAFAGDIAKGIIKLIGLFSPFILAFLLSLVLNPIADKLQKRFKLPRAFTAIFLIIAVLLVLGGLIGGIVYKIVEEIKDLYANFPQISEGFINWIDEIRSNMEYFYSSMPEYGRTAIDSLAENLKQNLTEFISRNYQPVVDSAGNVARKLPGVFVGIVVFILSLFFMVSDGKDIKTLLKKIIPDRIVKKFKAVSGELKKSLGGYIKAQLIIMSVVFVIVTAGLSILKIEYALLIATFIAVFDALPFFGSGAVLWPWAAVSFISSDIEIGIGLIIIYLSVLLTRQMIEPKIVSNKIGINPLITLMSMYVGYRVLSIGGMILGPIVLVLLISLYKAGVFEPVEKCIKGLFRTVKKEIKEICQYIDTK